MSKALRQQWSASSGSQVLWATSAFGPWHWCQAMPFYGQALCALPLTVPGPSLSSILNFLPLPPSAQALPICMNVSYLLPDPSRHQNFFCTLNANLVQSVLALGARMLTYFHFIYLFICFPVIDIFSSSPLSVWAPQSCSVPGLFLLSVKTGTTELWQAGFFWGKIKSRPAANFITNLLRSWGICSRMQLRRCLEKHGQVQR